MESNNIEVSEVKVCKDCGGYDRCSKKCKRSGKYTARKASCEEFLPVSGVKKS